MLFLNKLFKQLYFYMTNCHNLYAYTHTMSISVFCPPVIQLAMLPEDILTRSHSHAYLGHRLFITNYYIMSHSSADRENLVFNQSTLPAPIIKMYLIVASDLRTSSCPLFIYIINTTHTDRHTQFTFFVAKSSSQIPFLYKSCFRHYRNQQFLQCSAALTKHCL